MESRATPKDIADAVGMIHPNTIRNWADKGIIEAEHDFKGWRWFKNPQKTINHVKALLYGNVKPKGMR